MALPHAIQLAIVTAGMLLVLYSTLRTTSIWTNPRGIGAIYYYLILALAVYTSSAFQQGDFRPSAFFVDPFVLAGLGMSPISFALKMLLQRDLPGAAASAGLACSAWAIAALIVIKQSLAAGIVFYALLGLLFSWSAVAFAIGRIRGSGKKTTSSDEF